MEQQIETQTYGQWIKSVMNEKGLTPLTCCRRAKDERGKPMEHSQWNALMEDEPRRADGGAPKRSPKVARRVALGLDVSEQESINAAARAAGYTLPSDINKRWKEEREKNPDSLPPLPPGRIVDADKDTPATKRDIEEAMNNLRQTMLELLRKE